MLSFSEKVRFSLLDASKNMHSAKYYRTFKQSFKWTREELCDYQNNKLKQLINHAYENIPYYHSVFDKSGIKPADILNVKDLALLPFLTRDDIKSNQNLLIDKRNKYPKSFPSASSGTTGIPLKYINDSLGESAGIAAGFALYNLSDWRLGSKAIYIWGNPESIKRWSTIASQLKRIVMNQVRFPAFLLNDPGNYVQLFELIQQNKPDFIEGYASSIGSFANWLLDEGRHLDGIKAVFTTAENLVPIVRENISKTIGPVSDLYGCGEINGIAIQPVHEDRYYTLDSHVIVETSESGGMNEIVITNLDNRIMPFIRYKPGDTIDMLSTPGKEDKLPFMSFGRVDGRTSDYIRLPDGKIIHPVNLLGGTFLRKFPQIRKHKVTWNGRILNFIIEVSGPIEINELKKAISFNLQEYKIEFEVTIKDKLLPGPSGKYRYIEIIES